jgi:plasmid stability protein
MKNVQIRDVPDDIHATLAARAESENKSLQAYLSELLAREARATETVAFLRSLKPVRTESVVSTDEIVAMIRADRDSR